VLTGDQHRVARLAVIRGDGDRGARAVRGDQPARRLGPDQRLVGQGDHRGGDAGQVARRAAGVQCAQRGGERRAHAGRPVRVVHRARARYVDWDRPGHHEHRVGAARAQQCHAALGQGAAVQFHRCLRLAEAGTVPGGEQDPRDTCDHGPTVVHRPGTASSRQENVVTGRKPPG
jgi:hypothetical protein